MNNEIEEILYVLKHIVIGRASRLTSREADKLLGYITNLQQKEELLRQEISDVRKAFNDLQQNYNRIYNEDCKLREEHNITDISLLDENYKLKQENERLKEDNEFLKKELFKLEKRYLKGDLLNILQNGSDISVKD